MQMGRKQVIKGLHVAIEKITDLEIAPEVSKLYSVPNTFRVKTV